jgi:3'(2'), 5'-bisphosphate nucleotidase
MAQKVYLHFLLRSHIDHLIVNFLIKEYTQGADVAHEVTILIGVAWNGKPIAGVVNQPFYKKINETDYLGRVLWGIVGLGAYDLKNGKLNAPTKSSDELRIVTTRSHMTDLVKRSLTAIPNARLIHCGGAGYKILSVIDGNADCYIYPRNGTKRWDTCAPEALIRSLNGTLTDVFNNDYDYVKNEKTSVENYLGIIASMSQSNEFFVKHLSDELKQNVLADGEKFKPKL